MCKKLYICDGQACEDKEKYCYLTDGECFHTTDPNHSLKAKLQDDFPPTTFVEFCPGQNTGILAEGIDLVKFCREVASHKLHSL